MSSTLIGGADRASSMPSSTIGPGSGVLTGAAAGASADDGGEEEAEGDVGEDDDDDDECGGVALARAPVDAFAVEGPRVVDGFEVSRTLTTFAPAPLPPLPPTPPLSFAPRPLSAPLPRPRPLPALAALNSPRSSLPPLFGDPSCVALFTTTRRDEALARLAANMAERRTASATASASS